MSLAFRAGTALSLFIASGPAFSEPATPEGATRLKELFQTYLGNTPDVITVTPGGENYRAVVDPNPFFALGAEAGLTGTVTPMTLTLTDQGGGKWGVEQDEPFALTIDVPDVFSLDLRIAQSRWSGVFDEALIAFEQAEAEISGMRLEETFAEPGGPKMSITYAIDEMSYVSRATAAMGGGVDATMDYKVSGIVETISSAPNPDMPIPVSATFTIDSYDAAGEVKGMRTQGLYALLSWFVAHPSEEEIEADLAGTSDAIAAALPIFEALHLSGTFDNLDVVTPFGAGGADAGRFDIDLNGVVGEGRLREMVALQGLRLPEELMPDWVPQLLPDEVTLDFAVSGFDLAAPAAMLLEAMAENKEPDDARQAEILRALLPDGKLHVTFGPAGAASDIYDVDIEAEIVAGPADEPAGSAFISAGGIEAVLEALNDAPDDVRQGAVPAIMMMRGIAKPEEGGRYSWDVEFAGEKKVLVNGIDLTALSKGQ
ncbi:hypothetical protein DEA8626_03434 [Defluviimonas aquaemixtae]|uniref:DUF2125 domain-containing protein n=1 Tax=Albidovulum aquaemixtae TaxID=1542388 RepID=A0A2R8BM05_9RHOB|nr:hypothetical protein [Defluviimonas aquaemixtae]SPH24383.1 hypothetical protein DEA8626_03434 [Defluviimonas aquaemixtae]